MVSWYSRYVYVITSKAWRLAVFTETQRWKTQRCKKDTLKNLFILHFYWMRLSKFESFTLESLWNLPAVRPWCIEIWVFHFRVPWKPAVRHWSFNIFDSYPMYNMLVERTSYWDLALFLFLILRGSALFFLFFLTKDTFLVSFYTLTL